MGGGAEYRRHRCWNPAAAVLPYADDVPLSLRTLTFRIDLWALFLLGLARRVCLLTSGNLWGHA